MRSIIFAALLLAVPVPAIGQVAQPWQAPTYQPYSPQPQRFETTPYAAPGGSLLARPAYESWREPQAGTPLFADPRYRQEPSPYGRNLLR